jgi:hypothetical protein
MMNEIAQPASPSSSLEPASETRVAEGVLMEGGGMTSEVEGVEVGSSLAHAS